MSDSPVQEVVSDLFQHLEALETQCAAVVQFLKEKGLGTDEEFARSLQQASEASSIKWRAARLRMEHLFASVPEPSGKPSGSQAARPESGSQDQSKRDSSEAVEKGRKEAKAVDSSGKQNGERPQQPKASKRDSEGSGEKERPSQPSERAPSQSSEKPPREIRAEEETRLEEKKATKTGSAETKDDREQQGGEKAA